MSSLDASRTSSPATSGEGAKASRALAADLGHRAEDEQRAVGRRQHAQLGDRPGSARTPVSSASSRAAASCQDSPSSMKPPGSARPSGGIARRTARIPPPATRTTATATGSGLR
jgi:hypothetical protein